MKERPRTLFASVNLIGDTLAQTPAIRRYRTLHPEEEVHWVIQDEPMRTLFEGMPGEGVCDWIFVDGDWNRIRNMAYPGYEKRILMDVQVAFQLGAREGLHIAQGFAKMVGVELSRSEILPTVPLRKEDVDAVDVPERCLVVSPRSRSNVPVNKNLPWEAWPKIVDRFEQANRIDKHVVLMRANDPAPEVAMCVLRMSLSMTAAYIAKACALGGAYCGVDNGITHIASGLRVPTFCVYPAGMSETWTGYSNFGHYRIAKTLPWQGNVDEIWEAWKRRL